MMTPKEIARHITEVAEGKVDWTKAPCELWIEREINEYVQQQVKKCDLADVVECAGNKRTPHEKRSEVLSNPLWEYKAGLYKHFKWGWKTLDEAYQIVTS